MINRWTEHHPKQRKVRNRNPIQVARCDGLDVMDSHYCRHDSKKKYIAATFRSKVELYNGIRSTV